MTMIRSLLGLLRGKGRALVLALLITIVTMWFALRNSSSEDLVSALLATDWRCLLGVALLFMTQQWVRAWRQALILRAHHPAHRTWDSFGVLCVGFFFINSLPLRVGEVVRPLLLREREEIPLGRGFGMVFCERVIDFAAMLVMIGAVAWVLPVPSHEISLSVLGMSGSLDWVQLGRWAILGAVPLVLIAGGIVIVAGRRIIEALENFTAERGARARALSSRVSVFGEQFIPAVEALRNPKRMGGVILLSILTWVLTGCMYPLLAQGLGIGWFVGYGEGIAILGFTMLGMTLPSLFGFAGTYEAAVVLALSLFGVVGGVWWAGSTLDSLAVAYALTMHWWIYLVQTASAVVFLILWQIDLAGLFRGIRKIGQSD